MTWRKGPSVNPKLEQQAGAVIELVGCALKVFGGDRPTVEPPRFASGRDLEDDLGHGDF
jgi:hypothetical protein